MKRFNNPRHCTFWLTLTLALLLPVTVYAAHTTINTDDNILDPNWAGITQFAADGDDWPDDNYDIDRAWVTSSPDNSFFYFRADLIGAGLLPQDNWSSFEAHLDCDRDGNDYGPADVIVYYFPNSDAAVECQGPSWPICSPNDTNPASAGEMVAGSPNSYEWSADVNNGTIDWSACLGQINFRFITLDSTGAEADSTLTREYNVPTAVRLKSFDAARPDSHEKLALAMLVGFGGALAALAFWRRHNRVSER